MRTNKKARQSLGSSRVTIIFRPPADYQNVHDVKEADEDMGDCVNKCVRTNKKARQSLGSSRVTIIFRPPADYQSVYDVKEADEDMGDCVNKLTSL